jgi:hypothetical protein
MCSANDEMIEQLNRERAARYNRSKAAGVKEFLEVFKTGMDNGRLNRWDDMTLDDFEEAINDHIKMLRGE